MFGLASFVSLSVMINEWSMRTWSVPAKLVAAMSADNQSAAEMAKRVRRVSTDHSLGDQHPCNVAPKPRGPRRQVAVFGPSIENSAMLYRTSKTLAMRGARTCFMKDFTQ